MTIGQIIKSLKPPYSLQFNRSEHNTKPRYVLMHDPRNNKGLSKLHKGTLTTHNFLESPNLTKLYEEYELIQSLLRKNGIDVIELLDVVDSKDHETIIQNPNSIFTRDPVITIPWYPKLAIKGNMKLRGREKEPEIMVKAVGNLGITEVISLEEKYALEGGDIIPTMFEKQKIILFGYGTRSSENTAIALAQHLIPNHLDLILGLQNPKNILHLDSALSLLPNNTILTAEGVYKEGFLIDKTHQLKKIDPVRVSEQIGLVKYYITAEDAMTKESCNMLPLGDNSYLSLNIEDTLKTMIEKRTGTRILNLQCEEIPKGTGGVHCLTRPIY